MYPFWNKLSLKMELVIPKNLPPKYLASFSSSNVLTTSFTSSSLLKNNREKRDNDFFNLKKKG